MVTNIAKKRLLLLVEPNPSGSDDVRSWLAHRGMRIWQADNVSHAIEELSDFTVKNRPDVVMLEAVPISGCLQDLRTDLCGLFSATDVSVVAMGDSPAPSRPEPFFATNFAQLETILNRVAGGHPSV